MTGTTRRSLITIATAAAVVVGLTAQNAAAQRPLRFVKSDLFVEINGTDGDAGLQMDLGGEVWRRLTIRDPRGRIIVDVRGEGRLRNYGIADLFFESAEPPFDEVPLSRFKARFPEGRYTLNGTTVEGRRLIGSDRVTHSVPKKPVVLAPAENAVVDPAGLAVRWEPVTRPSGINIVRYVVIVTEESSERELSMDLRPDATSAAIPAGFLERGAEYKVEVLARAKSGNQTISEISFKTSG
jgi:hypothetical protein